MITVIISYLLSAALVIYLFKWYGVIGVVLFTLYALTAKQKKTETPVKGFLASLGSGIGIILLAVIVLMFLGYCKKVGLSDVQNDIKTTEMKGTQK